MCGHGRDVLLPCRGYREVVLLLCRGGNTHTGPPVPPSVCWRNLCAAPASTWAAVRFTVTVVAGARIRSITGCRPCWLCVVILPVAWCGGGRQLGRPGSVQYAFRGGLGHGVVDGDLKPEG